VKYWVYKDARILGPFDKDSVAGLPGVDASTLVCAGESAAAGEGDWRPAGDIADLAALPLDRGPAWPVDDMSSTYGILDKLQLETAGLIGDDEFPGAAEELFQDPTMKAAFGGLLTPRPTVDEAELRRAKDRAAELTVQLELLYKRVAELEAGQTSLVHRLAEKDLQLRTKLAASPAPAPEAAPPAPAPAPAAPPVASAPVAAPPPPVPAPAVPPPPADWAPAAGGGAFPSFPSLGEPAPAASAPLSAPPVAPIPSLFAPPAAPPAPPTPPSPPPAAPPAPTPPAPVDWAGPPVPVPADAPPIPALSPVPVPPAPVPAPPAPVPPAPAPAASAAPAAPEAVAPKKAHFEKKAFKIVPTVKSFRVVAPADPSTAAPLPTPAPAPVAAPPPPAPVMPAFAPAPAPAPIALEPVAPPPPPPPAEVVAPPPPPPPVEAIAPLSPEPVAAAPAFAEPLAAFDAPTQAVLNPMRPADPTPAPMPPATLSFGAPSKAEPSSEIPAFSNSFGGSDMAGAPSTEEALARLAKPAPAPPTKAPRPPRSNKPFLIGAAVLVVAMTVIGVVFLRHPKDLKQMTELDDGRARLGAEPVTDDAVRPPLVKPKMAAPPAEPAPPAPDAAETARAASQAKLDAAVDAVKDFPLDGDRGTVAQWLQFSYSASPDAGKEAWSASETADKTYLVEYRFSPARGGDDVHYLFEVDMDRGFVIGKNLDAKSVLAGGPRVSAEKPKAKSKSRKPGRKKTARRPAETATPKEVPLLPLPDEGALRPPAEDDGAFNSDTVNSGL